MNRTILPLDELRQLLKDQEDEEKEEEQKKKKKEDDDDKKKKTTTSLSIETIHQFYQDNGIQTPIKGIWERPIPPDIYRCPLSEPQTTLVTWNSLPRAIQALYTKPNTTTTTTTTNNHDEEEEDGILEIDRRHHHLLSNSQEESTTPPHGGTQGTVLSRRPLHGNLTSKLSEYTRGVSGQCRPFRPGGMDDGILGDNNNNDDDDDDVGNNFLSSQAIANSLKPLEQGSIASWKDGTLICAPPGVDFKIGLSYMDEDEDSDEKNKKDSIDPPQKDHSKSSQPDGDDGTTTLTTLRPSRLAAPAIQWNPNFLEDDSLFGSSDESESDDEDDDEDDKDGDPLEDDGKGDDEDRQNPKDNMGLSQDRDVVDPTETVMGSDPTTDTLITEEDIDVLLKEFSRAESRTKKEMTQKEDQEDGWHLNPLELAQRQTSLLTDSTRKTWASTSLLPIVDFHSWIPDPALTYPFTLDAFQQQAVARLERNESVFVAAHTSAGKTVVAEYAVALAKRHLSRCVYTSPIKALSNQKFRDFSQKFGPENVGLITGDLQLNVDDSSCLIMTTEILRSMLYRGADLIRDIEWVIFDEVHYVNDSERGVVWEEVIIMLPSYVNLIFLSATTPNTLEFSDWIGRTKRKPVYVIKTDYRPVPLSHHLWANLKLHRLMEGKSGFYDKGHQEATLALKPKDTKNAAKGAPKPISHARGPANMAWQAQGSKADWMSLIRFLEREELTPTVVFSFSKKKCVEIANMLQSLDMNTAAEGSIVQGFTLQTVARLSPNDAVLPQVMSVCEMVKRGIGVHHGGLLPILKEMVEILFSRNLIKVLFATETFAMGVNMPARSVVFNAIRKHDGAQFRVLEPGEYTQMAGRAGRRGLDKVGTVIITCFGETPPPIGMLRNMLTGQSTMLRSQFRLTYNMILNLLRVEDMSVENMIKRSFSEFATQRALTANDYPKLLARGRKTLTKLEEQLKEGAHQRVGAEDLEEYFVACTHLMEKNRELLLYISGSVDDSSDAVLQVGRVILITAARKYGVVRAPAIVLENRPSSASTDSTSTTTMNSGSLVCMVLLPPSYVPDPGLKHQEHPKIVSTGEKGYAKNRYYGIFEVSIDHILLVSATKKKIEPTTLFKGGSGTKASMGHGAASSSFFGAKPVSRGFDDPFAGFKARGKRQDDDAFFGKKKTNSAASETEPIEKAMDILIEAEAEETSSGLIPLDLSDAVKRGSDVVDFIRECSFIEILCAKMRSYRSHSHPSLDKHYLLVERMHMLRNRVDTLNHLLSNESLQLFPDYLQRKAVLQTLGYLDENETVSVKGRVACEVSSCDELIMTEMVFEGLLNELQPTEIVAALSALLYHERSEETLHVELPESLLSCCERMKSIAFDLGQMQRDHGLSVDPQDYAESSLKFGLVHVVYEWALGVPFSNICELTEAQEGSIVRCITRLDELCREVRDCARVVGNPTLYRKMEAASVAIKRDIVFAASLYVS